MEQTMSNVTERDVNEMVTEEDRMGEAPFPGELPFEETSVGKEMEKIREGQRRASRILQTTQNNQAGAAATDPLGEAGDEMDMETLADEYEGLVVMKHDLMPAGERYQYLRQTLIESECYGHWGAIQRTEKLIGQKVDQLRDMVMRPRRGVQMDDYNRALEGLQGFIETLEMQAAVHHVMLDACERAYSRLFNKGWTPPTQRDKGNPAETASRREAIEVLKRFGKFQ
jgi:hypothetical protein